MGRRTADDGRRPHAERVPAYRRDTARIRLVCSSFQHQRSLFLRTRHVTTSLLYCYNRPSFEGAMVSVWFVLVHIIPNARHSCESRNPEAGCSFRQIWIPNRVGNDRRLGINQEPRLTDKSNDFSKKLPLERFGLRARAAPESSPCSGFPINHPERGSSSS